MKRAHKAPPMGTVSHATMRSEDLIPAFLDELEYRNKRHAGKIRREYRDVLRTMACELYSCRRANHVHGELGENMDYMVDALFDALNEYCLPYFYFGAHEGDGSDYGYWLAWDSIQDDIRSGEIFEWDGERPLPKGEHNYLIDINDHGNATLYTKRGREIWAVV